MQKDVTECVMMKGEVAKMNEYPSAISIVIAPSEREALRYAEEVLAPYYSGYPQRLNFSFIQSFLLPPVTKTVFLYTSKDGEIKVDTSKPYGVPEGFTGKDGDYDYE
jgi:hypothetical protein